MKNLMSKVGLVIVLLIAISIYAEAHPRFYNHHRHFGMRKQMVLNAEAQRFADMKAMAMADGRISPRERTILRYERNRMQALKPNFRRNSFR
jgi:hypothetical protein